MIRQKKKVRPFSSQSLSSHWIQGRSPAVHRSFAQHPTSAANTLAKSDSSLFIEMKIGIRSRTMASRWTSFGWKFVWGFCFILFNIPSDEEEQKPRVDTRAWENLNEHKNLYSIYNCCCCVLFAHCQAPYWTPANFFLDLIQCTHFNDSDEFHDRSESEIDYLKWRRRLSGLPSFVCVPKCQWQEWM